MTSKGDNDFQDAALVDAINAMLDEVCDRDTEEGVVFFECDVLSPQGIRPLHVFASSDPRFMERVRRLHVDMYGCDFEEWEP